MFRGGVDRQFGIQRCKLVYIELTDNKVLIYSSGNYIQYPVINHTYIYIHTHIYIYIYIHIYVHTHTHTRIRGFPGGTSGKELACQCRRHKRHGFHPWVGKILWRREGQPTPVFLPGKSLWTEEPDGPSPSPGHPPDPVTDSTSSPLPGRFFATELQFSSIQSLSHV